MKFLENIFFKFPPKPVKSYPQENVDNDVDIEREIATSLVLWAMTKVGIKEVGENSGKEVEEFQKTVDGVAGNEAWCVGFVQTGAKKVSEGYGVGNPLHQTESSQTLWNQTQKIPYICKEPAAGRIAVWKHKTKPGGHAGICATALISNNKFITIEGNTSISPGVYGVAEKQRSMDGMKEYDLLGFIDLPLMIAARSNHATRLGTNKNP